MKAGGGWPAIWYTLRKARGIGWGRMWKSLRSRNACKTCALGMGGQLGGMTNERGRFPEVCKKSVQAMAADLQGAIHGNFFRDFSLEQLQAFSSRELEASGRITQPLFAGPLDSHYRAISWEEAIERIAKKLRKTDPHEAFFYFSGRSSNEAAFLLQLMARLWGTNHINNCSYYCHQASGVGLASVTGSGTATIELEDLEHADLLFVIGANPASNHPRLMRTIIDLKRRGGKVIVINPLKELGLVRFRVPSDVRSMLFGSDIADEYLQPHIGGDIALLSGLAKAVLEAGTADEQYLANCTDGWSVFRVHLQSLDWATIVHRSGVERAAIERIARLYAASKNSIFAWAMGLTHHEHGVANIQAVANLALLRGMVGGRGRGLLPLRGHSNVQGIGSMGVTPTLRDAVFRKLQDEFKITLPLWPGMDTLACMHAAHEGKVRFAMCLGGNLFGSNPDAKFAAEAMSRIDQVVYLSTTLNTGHAWGRGRETIILPVKPRDEESQATTQESMFNFVRLSDGGPARHEGPRSEVETIAAVGHALLGDRPDLPMKWSDLASHEHIRQLIARIIPGYEKLGDIDRTKREFTIAGRVLHQPKFATDTGRAKLHVIALPELLGDAEAKGAGARCQMSDGRTRNSELGTRNFLRLMTLRSEGQFNTVVYEEQDIYRGQERRDVILMNAADIRRLRLREDQPVTVRNEVGSMPNILVREFDLPPGNAAMYYPEANVLVPREADALSRTPRFKSVLVEIEG